MASSENVEILDSIAQSIIDNIKNSNISESEKLEAIKVITNLYSNKNKKKVQCDKCQNWVLNLKACEFCIVKYLEKNVWTSGDKDYDKLIKTYQNGVVKPETIIEWIPYDKLKDVEYETEGGFYKIFRALWTEGRFISWDLDRQKLKRSGTQSVTIKHINSSQPHRYNEIKAHLSLSASNSPVRLGYGLTKDPESNSYMIVMESVDCNLRSYIQESIKTLTWFHKYKILLDIALSLECVHKNGLIHRDLHPGNVMYSNKSERWLIGDFGLCSSTPTNLIQGMMPFIAPEIIKREPITMKSDIYSFAMIMYEVSTGHPPSSRSESEPKIMRETPEHYEDLMKRCWDDNPTNRPDIGEIKNEIKKIVDNSKDDKVSEKYMLKKKNFFHQVFIEEEAGIEAKINEGTTQPVKNVPPVEVKIITQDQIGAEEVFEGIGLISHTSMLFEKEVRSVAIKSLQIYKSNESKNSVFLKTLRDKINETKARIFGHPNIVEFLGVGIRDENKLFLVMPFADGGNLRSYYRTHKLSFNKKIEIVKGITEGIKILHESEIIHENINPDNILIFNGVAKISNLPLLYNNTDLYFKNKEFYFDEKLFENIGYVDPNTIMNRKNYKKDKPVDIYSLGTLLWEIISERVPYLAEQDKKTISKIILGIAYGDREADVTNAPDEYIKLYKKCWDGNNLCRPSIYDIYEQMRAIF